MVFMGEALFGSCWTFRIHILFMVSSKKHVDYCLYLCCACCDAIPPPPPSRAFPLSSLLTAPQVTCLTRTWHPSIDLHTGEVHLAIFGASWRPVLTINNVIFCLQLLFVEPNPDNPCNIHAAQTLTNDPPQFEQQVYNRQPPPLPL
jgi:hypothetical protein